jgi:hypothetical protein
MKLIIFIVFFFIIVCIILFNVSNFEEFMKKKENIYDVAYDLGIHYLDQVGYNPRYMVMFDIDDTLLYVSTMKPIKKMVKLLKECKKRNLKVAIITARDSKYTNGTLQDLKNIGITDKDYDFLYLRVSPQDDHEMFKSDVKEDLYDEGFFTIMSIGDNNIDIVGPYSGYGIKLPNVSDPRLFHINNKGKLENVLIS